MSARGTKARPEVTGHDGGVGLFLEMREQRGGEPDWAKEVGGDDGFGVGYVCGLS